MPFYAVKSGREPGIFDTWDDCKAQVSGFPKAIYKKFDTRQAAESFMSSSAPPAATGGAAGKKNSGCWYAVREGHRTGIYETWPECQAQISGYRCAKFKKFKSYDDALEFLGLRLDERVKSAPAADVAEAKPNRSEDQKVKITPAHYSTPKEPSDVRPAERLESAMKQLLRGKKTSSQVPRKRMSPCRDESPKKSRKVAELEPNIASANLKPLDTKEPEYVVYTDGACTNNGMRDKAKVCAGYGVWWGSDHPWNESRRLKGQQTNNRAEIEAVIAAVKRAQMEGIQRLEIRTDSVFTINCITKWVKKWRQNDWQLCDGTDVKVRSSIERLDDLLMESGVDVVWTHVAGHSGIPGNEAADRLARWGAMGFDSGDSDEDLFS